MQDEIQYRDAIPSDAERLSLLFANVYIHTYGFAGVSNEYAHYALPQFSVERIRNKIIAHPGYIIVAIFQSNLVGVAEIDDPHTSPVGDVHAPELNKLYVLHNFNGLGIGSKLIELVEQAVKQHGHQEIWFWVWKPNTRAIRFYEHVGYRSIGEAMYHMQDNSYENLIMYKQLS
jgi:ribosomal protein S18 acetylase RimI-like enzyme